MTVNTEFLKEILAKRNWSMRKLAYKAGVSQATLSRVFNGKRGVGVKLLMLSVKHFRIFHWTSYSFFSPFSYHMVGGVTHELSVVIPLKKFFEN